MPKITAIKSQKRINRLSIFIDGEFFIGTTANLLLKHPEYSVNAVLNEIEIENLRNDVSYFEAREYVLKLLAQREYSPKEISNKLRQREWIKHSEDLIDYLIGKNFIDIERFSRAFIRDRAKIKGWGPTRIKNELIHNKGIPQETAIQMLDAYFQEHSVDDSALRYALKKSKLLDLSDRNHKNKLWNAMTRHGFTSDQIKRALEKLGSNEESEALIEDINN